MSSVNRPVNPVVRRAFPLLVFFLAAIFCGIFDKVPFLYHFHILTIVGGLGLILVASGGRLPAVLSNPIGKCLILFSVWFVLCIPFGRWPGGSFKILENVWSRSFLTFVLVAGCILTIEQCKTTFKTIGYSVGVLSILALLLRGYDLTGRLGLRDTRYDNSNDLAWTLILGLSFLSFLIQRGSRSQKKIALLLTAPILLALVKTGSRAGMIGFGMLAVFGFFQASRAVRIKLAFAIPLTLVVLVALTPRLLLSRYITFAGVAEGSNLLTARTLQERVDQGAAGSATLRKQMLKDSIYFTVTHPLLGLGPNGFPAAQADLAIARGDTKGAWMVTHNTYTQISSEMGIPGLVIYIAFLYYCIKPLNSILRSRNPGRNWQDLRALAKSLRASFVVMMTIAVFDAYGYDLNIPLLGGLSCALAFIAQRERALLTASPPVTRETGLAAEPALEPVGMGLQ